MGLSLCYNKLMLQVDSYNKLVKWLKIILITINIGLFLSFIVVPIVSLKIKSSYVFFGRSLLDTLLKKDIAPPVLSGTTADGGFYYLSARKMSSNIFNLSQTAVEVYITEPYFIYNHAPHVLKARSSSAIYYSHNQVLQFKNRIYVNFNQNAKAILKGASVSLQSEKLTSDEPLMAHFDEHLLTCSGLVIDNKNQTLALKGPVDITTPEELPPEMNTTSSLLIQDEGDHEPPVNPLEPKK